MGKFFLSFILPIILFVAILGGSATYTMLEAFVLDREIAVETIDRHPSATVKPEGENTSENTPATDAPATDAPATGDTPSEDVTTIAPSEPEPDPEPEVTYPIIGDLYYKDENIEITITEEYYDNANGFPNKIFVVDLKLSSVEYLRTFVNTSSSGKVSKTTVRDMAEKNNAIFAINGDYFSYREKGLVLRDYSTVWYRTARSRSDDDALCILADGSFLLLNERELANSKKQIALENIPSDAYQIFSFGPHLIVDGEIAVTMKDEVDQSTTSNPRTAIGMVEPLHYKIVVAEGRLKEYDGRDGLTLYEMADILKKQGCTQAYNLDGGSSTTLYFNGQVLNRVTSSGERSVSDCIYISGVSYSQSVSGKENG